MDKVPQTVTPSSDPPEVASQHTDNAPSNSAQGVGNTREGEKVAQQGGGNIRTGDIKGNPIMIAGGIKTGDNTTFSFGH